MCECEMNVIFYSKYVGKHAWKNIVLFSYVTNSATLMYCIIFDSIMVLTKVLDKLLVAVQ